MAMNTIIKYILVGFGYTVVINAMAEMYFALWGKGLKSLFECNWYGKTVVGWAFCCLVWYIINVA